MTPPVRLRIGLVSLAALIVLGTAAYVLVEGVGWFDAFYMVMVTISTVGFREVFELSRVGQVLTIGIMVGGVGLAFYTAGAALEQLVAYSVTRQRTRVQTMIDRLQNHVILCGFGRVGRRVWEALRSRDVDVVVVETDPARVEQATQAGAFVVAGDATHNDVLRQAGIDRARALVACVRLDADNLVIVLSARALRPDLHIVSRASEAESEPKLRLAGADRIVAPQVVGAERLAAMTVEPELTEFFDVFVRGRAIEFAVEEVVVSPNSPMAGKTIRESGIREKSGALILAVEDRNGRLLTAPSPEQAIEPGRMVIVVGSRGEVEEAARLLAD
ncbi:MAG: potassium transporter TrkA [Acidimicrobiia bacterium]|nr:MAG: potassium transporter TrkA [Acidimicrobiia bacterium]